MWVDNSEYSDEQVVAFEHFEQTADVDFLKIKKFKETILIYTFSKSPKNCLINYYFTQAVSVVWAVHIGLQLRLP
jgi:hypothetical protein